MSKVIWVIIIVLVVLGVFLFINRGRQPGDSSLSENEQSAVSSIKDDPAVRIADLKAVDGSSSAGTAYLVRRDGKLRHRVEASMPDPAPGNSYEGWLVEVPSSPVRFFSTGVMSRNSGGLWVLEYEADQEYPAYNRVVITEETIVDATPEKHIIEGDFQE